MVKIGFIFVIHNTDWMPLIDSVKALGQNGKYKYFIFVDNDCDTNIPARFLFDFKDDIVVKISKTKNVSYNRNYFLKESAAFDVDFLVFNDYDDKFDSEGLRLLQNIPSETFINSDAIVFASSVSSNDTTLVIKSAINYCFDNFRSSNRPSFSFPHLSSWVFRREFLVNNKITFDESLKGSEDTKFLVEFMLRKPRIIRQNAVLRVIARHQLNTTSDIYSVKLLKYRILAYGSMFISFVKYRKFEMAWKACVVVCKSFMKLIGRTILNGNYYIYFL